MVLWHRLLGLTMMDYLTDSPFDVELEKDLSVRQQFLDILIIRRKPGEMAQPLPDGLDNLSEHNLITFKSHHEALDSWAMDELLGHTVSYRKLVSPRGEPLLPVEQFRVYGVCARSPQKLRKHVRLRRVQAGVYQARWGAHQARILVLSEMPASPQNAMWELFSGIPAKVEEGARLYQPKTPDVQGVMNALFEHYRLEGAEMAYTWEDFRKEYTREHLKDLSPDEVLSRFSAEELARRLTPEERLNGLGSEELARRLTPEERLNGLRPDELTRRLTPEERLNGLRPEDIEAYLRRKKAAG